MKGLTKKLRLVRSLALKRLREVEKEERLRKKTKILEGERQREEWI